VYVVATDYYTSKNPQIKVNVEVLPEEKEARSVKLQKLRTEIMSGNGPDIYLLNGFETYEDEALEPLFTDIEKTMESGIFAGLNKNMEKDDYWKSGDYKEALSDCSTGKRKV
jgi:ABC-type glycerol-3-phosphate transport system substrate-binding protein